MPELVFIREIDPNTILHFASRGEGTCLRDYSRGQLSPPVENRGYTTSQVRELLQQPGNHSENAPEHPVTDLPYWYQVVTDCNDRLGYSGNDEPGQFTRPLDQLHAELAPLVSPEKRLELKEKICEWTQKLTAIKTKTTGFNHYDNDDVAGRFKLSEGRGWSSRMLEFSRSEGAVRYIDVGDDSLDFALLAMEPNMSISSKSNPVRPGAKGSVNLDGLGVRRDGTFCVVEVKAESDTPELYRATIQALCGAVAVYAKREMIVGLAQKAHGRRPACPSTTISDSPSIGLYIMVDSRNFFLPENSEFRESIQLLLEAFPAIREVVYFSVDPTSSDFPASISATHIITREHISHHE